MRLRAVGRRRSSGGGLRGHATCGSVRARPLSGGRARPPAGRRARPPAGARALSDRNVKLLLSERAEGGRV
jgi:hypothetical protein